MSGLLDPFWLRREANSLPPADDLDPATIDLDAFPKCAECGYSFYKLASMRCPECGALVRPEDLTPGIDQAWLRSIARRERILRIVGTSMLLAGLGLFAYSLHNEWAVRVCVISPLVATSVVFLGRQALLGEEMHWPLMIFGFCWLATGALLALVA